MGQGIILDLSQIFFSLPRDITKSPLALLFAAEVQPLSSVCGKIYLSWLLGCSLHSPRILRHPCLAGAHQPGEASSAIPGQVQVCSVTSSGVFLCSCSARPTLQRKHKSRTVRTEQMKYCESKDMSYSFD